MILTYLANAALAYWFVMMLYGLGTSDGNRRVELVWCEAVTLFAGPLFIPIAGRLRK